MEINWLLWLSALGIYLHAIFVSVTLSFPIVIMALLLKYNKTKKDYFRIAKFSISIRSLLPPS